MKIIDKLTRFFRRKNSNTVPLVVIKKTTNEKDTKEYNSIEEAISDLESDPNVSKVLIEKLKSSFKNLKNKTSIKIRNGEILK